MLVLNARVRGSGARARARYRAPNARALLIIGYDIILC